MKISMYMYDKPIELDEDSTELFLEQYDKARDEMKKLLNIFEEEETRVALFHMMTLRCFIDDFLEFCADGMTRDEMEVLLNGISEYDMDFGELEEDDEYEIEVNFDDEEE